MVQIFFHISVDFYTLLFFFLTGNSMRFQSVLIFSVFVMLLSVAPAMAIPATTHDVTFVNTAGETIWVNVQGGPKGVCTDVTDPNTHRDKTCTACSMCDPDSHGNRSLCNVSASTGTLEPLNCPGVLADRNYCWGGTQCKRTNYCPGETATGGQIYACPGTGWYGDGITGFNATTPANRSVVDSLSGYNNPALGLHRIPQGSGTLLGGGNITLGAGKSITFPLQYGWQGAFYPRTNCVFDADGFGQCETGNCIDFLGDSVIGCGGAGSANPVTKAELNLDDNGDWFDVSYVNGFNVGVTIEPGNVNLGSDNCHTAGCDVSLPDFNSPAVPDISSLLSISNGKVVAISAACDLATNKYGAGADITKAYCCPYPPYINSEAERKQPSDKICPGLNSSAYPFTETGAFPNSARLFFDTCNIAYSYAYNDSVPNRVCHNAAGKISSYTITFYPPNQFRLSPLGGNLGSSDSSLSPSSSSTGSTVAVAPGGSPGQELTLLFGQATRAGSPIAVSHVSLTPSGGSEAFSLLAKPVSLGSAMQISGRPVAGYVEISPIGVNPSSVDFHIIRFSVSGAWLTENKISPGSIVLARYHDGKWNELPTTPAGTSGTDFLFDADTPGFSYFAVTVNQTAGAAATATLSPASALIVTAGDTPGIAGTIAGTTATRTVVTEQTTVPPVMQPGAQPASPSSSPLSPVTIAIAVIAVLVGTGSAVIARRWWIRKQNPALFKKYD
jgi:hypothetical protein